MMRFVLPLVGLALGLATMGCAPGSCGTVTLNGIAQNGAIEAFRNADGTIGLQELCGTDYGAFATARSDSRITTLVMSANVPGADIAQDVDVEDVILPAASVLFWSAHMKQGTTLTIANLAGGGLQKPNAADTYQTFPLTGGTVTFLSGPNNHEVDELIDSSAWREEWEIEWSLDYSGVQHWEGKDTVKRMNGTEIGSEPFSPPDPEPTGG
ncbi:MAG: hypothetical protein U0441_36975 [Polyangiaceae bacterium]